MEEIDVTCTGQTNRITEYSGPECRRILKQRDDVILWFDIRRFPHFMILISCGCESDFLLEREVQGIAVNQRKLMHE